MNYNRPSDENYSTFKNPNSIINQNIQDASGFGLDDNGSENSFFNRLDLYLAK